MMLGIGAPEGAPFYIPRKPARRRRRIIILAVGVRGEGHLKLLHLKEPIIL